jgi:hypothetical protein
LRRVANHRAAAVTLIPRARRAAAEAEGAFVFSKPRIVGSMEAQP